VSLSQACSFPPVEYQDHRLFSHKPFNHSSIDVRSSHYTCFGVIGRYSAPVCEEVILDLLCGDHNQFTDWLKKIEVLGSDPDLRKTLKGRIFGQVRQRQWPRIRVRVAVE